MSNDNEKNLNTPEGTPDEDVKQEMENLASVFQSELNKTTAQANADAPADEAPVSDVPADDVPVIQPLDFDSEDESGADADSAADSSSAERKPKNTEKKDGGKKKKKKKNGSHTAAFVIPMLICTIIAVFSIYAVFVCLTTSLDDIIVSVTNAEKADVKDDKLSFYKEALEYCNKDTKNADSLSKAEAKVYNSYIEEINEHITVLTFETKDYTTAYNYYKSASFPEYKDGKNARLPEFTNFLDACNKVMSIGNSIYGTVATVSENGTKTPDAAKICETLGLPAFFTDNCGTIATSIYEGIASYNAEKYADAVTSFTDAAASLKNTLDGVVSQELIEKTAVATYKSGSVSDTVKYISANMTAEMSANPISEEYKGIINLLDSTGEQAAKLYPAISAALAKDANADIDAVIKTLNANESQNTVLKGIADDIVKAIKASGTGNITSVYFNLGNVYEEITDLGGTPDAEMLKILSDAAFKYGAFDLANEIATKYFTADSLENYNNITVSYNAYSAARDVLNNAFSSSYYGGSVSFDSIAKSLDALVNENSTNIEKAFVSFFKGVTVSNTLQAEPTADDFSSIIKYIADAKELYPECLLFINNLPSLYAASGDFDSAYKYASEILAIDSGSDAALSILSENARRKGDIDAALAYALKGADSYEGNTLSAIQAVIGYMLKDDFDNAGKYFIQGWSKTLECYQLAAVFEKLYKGNNAEVLSFISTAMSEVNSYYQQSGASYSDRTKALIDGTKTLKDVFMADTYDLS